MEVPVFVETNLGTRLAMGVSPNITAADFKSELKRTHIESFPELGILAIDTIMVKRKSKFYCLPDSMPLNYVCQGCKKLCFVHVNACLPKDLEKHSVTVGDQIKVKKTNTSIKRKKRKLRTWCPKAVLLGLVSTAFAWRKKKRKKRRHVPKKLPALNNLERPEQECLGLGGQTSCVSRGEGCPREDVSDPAQVSESLSGVISVSGIIDRYYSGLVELDQVDSPWSTEVASKAGQKQLEEQNMLRHRKKRVVCKTTQLLLSSPLSEDPNSVVSRNKCKRSEFGERLVLASSTLRLGSNQRSSGSRISKGRKFLEPDAGLIARSLVFEISDDSEDL